ncbi:hypothetical protein IJT10_02860 [bacterium]|nr:hypothetical protein [bacterium]
MKNAIYIISALLLSIAHSYLQQGALAGSSPSIDGWFLCIYPLIFVLVGLGVDRFNYNSLFSIAGGFIILSSIAFDDSPQVFYYTNLLGLSLIVVSSAVEVRSNSPQKCLPLAFYLAALVLGQSWGRGLYNQGLPSLWPLLFLIVAILGLSVYQYRQEGTFRSKSTEAVPLALNAKKICVLSLILMAVWLQAFLVGYPYEEINIFSLIFGDLAFAVGIIAGGWLADKVGIMKPVLLSLLLLLVISSWSSLFLLAKFLTGLYVPITLHIFFKILYNRYGLAFALFYLLLTLGQIFCPELKGNILLFNVRWYVLVALASSYGALYISYDIINPIDQTSPRATQKEIINEHKIC